MRFLLALLAGLSAAISSDNRALRQRVLDAGLTSTDDVNTDTDTICGVPIPIYGPAALPQDAR